MGIKLVNLSTICLTLCLCLAHILGGKAFRLLLLTPLIVYSQRIAVVETTTSHMGKSSILWQPHMYIVF